MLLSETSGDRRLTTSGFPGLAALRLEILRNAGWSLMAAVIARGANVLVLMACARILAQERLGELAITQSTVGLFGSLAGLGLGMTTTKFLAEYRSSDPARAGRILALSLITAVVSALAMTGGFIALAPWVAARSLAAPGMSWVLIASSGLLGLGVIEAVETGALTGFEAFRTIATLSAWAGVASLPLTALLVWWFGLGGAIAGLTLTLALSCILNGVALWKECRRHGVHMQFAGCLEERRILIGFSLPAYLSGVIVAPTTWLASAMLVNQPGGYAEMALYAAADRFRFILIFVPLAACRLIVPALARYRASGDQHGYASVLRLNLQLGLALTVIPAAICALASPYLMNLYGTAFRHGWPIMAILSFSAIPTVLNTQFGSVLLGDDRAWTRMAVDVFLGLVCIGVAWLAVPRWGASGLAVAFSAAYTVATIVLLICLRSRRSL